MNWHEKQTQILRAEGGILVPASAGSGKTTVMVQKIINRALSGVPLSKILVLVYNNAAAAEIRERVRVKLFDYARMSKGRLVEAVKRDLQDKSAVVDADKLRERLLDEADFVMRAPIKTVHAFCADTLRENFEQVNLSPSFDILTDGEKEVFVAKAFERCFKKYLESGDEEFFELVEVLGGRKEAALREMVMLVYNKAVQQPDFEAFLAATVKNAEEGVSGEAGRFITEYYAELFSDYKKTAEEIDLLVPPECVKRHAALKDIIDACDLLVSVRGFEEFVKTLAAVTRTRYIFSGKAEYLEDRKLESAMADIYNLKQGSLSSTSFWQLVRELQGEYGDWEFLKKAAEQNARYTKKLVEITRRFRLSYGEVKQEKEKLDFNDLEQHMLAFLKSEEAQQAEEENARQADAEDNGAKSYDADYDADQKTRLAADGKAEAEADDASAKQAAADMSDVEEQDGFSKRAGAKSVADKFEYVFADEFQDINPIQDEIIARLSKEENYFYVGDVKQSIYGFRHTTPEIFAAKCKAAREGALEGVNEYPLDLNFRSRKGILSFVNMVFDAVMTEKSCGISYKDFGRFELSDVQSFGASDDAVAVMGEASAEVLENDFSKSVFVRLFEKERAKPSKELKKTDGAEGNLAEYKAGQTIENATANDEKHGVSRDIFEKTDETSQNLAGEKIENSAEGAQAVPKSLTENTALLPAKANGVYSVLEAAQEVQDDEEMSAAKAEGVFIAEKIKEMKGRAKTRAGALMEYGDFAILFRSRNSARAVLEVLKDYGIPFDEDAFIRTEHERETNEILSMLYAVDNPRNDIPFAAFMVSPFGGWTLKELKEIKKHGVSREKTLKTDEKLLNAADDSAQDGVPEYDSAQDGVSKKEKRERKSFYDVCVEHDGIHKEKMSKFLTFFENIRFKSRYKNVFAFVTGIISDVDYEAVVLSREDGCARLGCLHEFLEKVNNTDAASVSLFLSEYETIKNADSRKASLAESRDKVVVSTIHGSKGLEYETVFLAAFHFSPSDKDIQKDVVFENGRLLDSAEIMGIRYFDRARRAKSDGLSFKAARLIYLKRSLREEMRLLYVALTRAKSYLFLTGKSFDFEAFPKHYSRGKRFSDFLSEAAAKCPKLRQAYEVLDADACSLPAKALAGKGVLSRPIEEVDPIYYNIIVDRLNYQYKYEKATAVGAKWTVTELNNLEQVKGATDDDGFLGGEDEGAYGDVASPESITDEETSGAKNDKDALRRGVVFHHVMEKIDLRLQTEQEVADFVESMQEEGELSKADAAFVSIQDIVRCLNSDIIKEARSNHFVREKPFLMYVPSKDVLGEDSGEKVLVQGVIDLIIFGKRTIVVDFKNSSKSNEEIIRSYKKQLYIYKMAVEHAFDAKNVEIYIFSAQNGQILRV